MRARIGFNGMFHESGNTVQLLGDGHRPFSPMLIRFYRPDGLCPFARGGINTYAYCEGEPVNRIDPSGRFALALLVGGLLVSGMATAVINFLGQPQVEVREVEQVGTTTLSAAALAAHLARFPAMLDADAFTLGVNA